MKSLNYRLCCLLLWFAIPSLVSAEDDLRAFMLASSCAACHGTDGNSPGAIPSLKGKSANFITTALKEFKSGASASTMMGRLAKGYSDEEIELIARWFAGKGQR